MHQSQSTWTTPPKKTLKNLLENYATVAGSNDEMLDPQGAVRPHWEWINAKLGGDDGGGLTEYGRQAEETVRQHGIVYNVYSDAKGMDRPWALDLLPVVLPTDEWAQIERGVKQRLFVLNRILKDLYGPQKMLRDKVVPHEFVHANPNFHRACHGMPVTAQGHVTRYAVDLVRGPSGQWMVHSDRTQAPSGAGYALENRIVMAETFPNLFAEGRIERLAEFFKAYRDSVVRMAPRGKIDPTVVLHTPGPLNEAYFEHVYIARYLGINLLEGADLTVRDNHVYLKTIEGLKGVDVLLRRVDDAFSDPLELRKDSTLGIAGLLQAVRGGNVAVCNALGSSLLEVPAVASILPRATQFVLGEDLILPSVPTRWGAQEADRRWMEANFDSLKLLPAFGDMRKSVSLAALSEADREASIARWKVRPHDFVSVDSPVPSTVPVYNMDRLVPNSLVLRVYAVVGEDDEDIRVLPGGLARFSPKEDVSKITMQQGCGSKDVWVMARKESTFRSLLEDVSAPLTIRRSPANLSSRLAENLLWLGRYCERAEATVRYLRHLMNLCSEESGVRSAGELEVLLTAAPLGLFKKPATAGELADGVSQVLEKRGGERSVSGIRKEIIKAIFDGQKANTVVSTIMAVRRTAWVVRERFSEDDWRILNSFTMEFIRLQERRVRPGQGEIASALNQLVAGFAAFSGLVRENMTREPGEAFLDLGRRLERSSQTTHLVLHTLLRKQDHEEAVLKSLLSICDSPMTYRARYGAIFQAAPVVDLLVCDQTNPRSVAYQMQRILEQIARLPKAGSAGLFNEEERIVERLNTEIRTADANALASPGKTGERTGLQRMMVRLEGELPRLADLLEQQYFIHTSPARPLDDLR